MSFSRFLVALLLAVALSGGPAVRVFAMAMPMGPEAGSPNHTHEMQMDHASHLATAPCHHEQSNCDGAQPSCDGMCCHVCATGVAAVMLPPTATAVLVRPIRIPIEPSLSSDSLVFPRERPPRLLSF